ncbi:MAG: bifunctional UDP-N-acetylglucosamine diphosphorylase/glucosamine-1-phosphate N-acetyltransferase GlmU [Pseudomonadota bacterium]
MSLTTVILAAGQGKRMHSDTPKVLHKLAGVSLLEHVINTSSQVNNHQPPFVIYGHAGEKVQDALSHLDVSWIPQAQQLGTGHALQQALPHLPDDGRVLILYGDVPLISAETLKNFIAATPPDTLGMLTTYLADPTGFGRIIRDAAGKIIKVTEEKDADSTALAIHEINSGIYLAPTQFLKQWLPTLNNQNMQQEYYLTDIIPLATQQNIAIHASHPGSYEEVLGVNDRVQLAALERYYQRRIAEKLMRQGVTLLDPLRFDVRGDLLVGADTVIDINVIIEGHVKIGKHCSIGPNTILRNTVIGDHVEIRANSVIDGVEISEHCTVGPFARLRPGTILGPRSHVGNFVEIKNSDIGEGSKVNHLSYIGDSEIGKLVNIGAGAITCNYDGINKNHTVIGDNAFIGSNASLVAPITIGENATIGAGSTITRDAPPGKLTVARALQKTITNWCRPGKNKED